MAQSRKTSAIAAIARIETFINGNEFANASLAYLRTNEKNLERNWDKFDTAFDELFETATRTERNALEETYRRIEERYLNAQTAIAERIETVIANANANANVNANANANANGNGAAAAQQAAIVVNNLDYRKIKNIWGTFGGRYSEWRPFRDRYSASIHNVDSIPGAMKFQYLRDSLTGPALETLGTWPETDANYQLAWQTVNNRYDKPYLAMKELWARLAEVPVISKQSASSLYHLCDVYNDVVRQFQALGEHTENWASMIVNDITNKLDVKTREAWELQRQNDNPTIQDITSYLERYANAIVIVAENTTNKREHPEKREYVEKGKEKNMKRFKSSNERTEKPGTIQKKKCVLCGEAHWLFFCKKYLAKSVNERWKFVFSKKLCLNCLSDQHMAKDCVQKACRNCDKRHNSTLCRVNVKNVNAIGIKKEKFSTGAKNSATEVVKLENASN